MRVLLLSWLMIGLGMAQAETLDDPMRPPGHVLPGAAGKAKPGWHLSAIRIDERHRIAIINGRRLRVGARINQAQVIEILPQKVRLRGEQGEFSIRLVKTRVKRMQRDGHSTGIN